jgi:adenosylcobinamide-GDP ribazoletransferase
VSALLAAARYLTILPYPGTAAAVPGRADGSLERVGRGAIWFPVIGLALGGVLLALEWVATRLFPPMLAALLVVTGWKLVSGGLHLDGLADCLDGLIGRDASQRLAIMRDSRIGAFGAMGLIFFLFLEIAALAELPRWARGPSLLVAPVVGRAAPVLLAHLFRPARADGQGAQFRRGLRPYAPVVALVMALAVGVAALGWIGIVAVGAAAIIAVAVGRYMMARLGGVTGDVLGAAVELSELVVLLTVSAWIHARL